ncbi:S24/S26 family peptidase [Corynebacterium urinipleomorphum]|uniref:signal peptidase I n=1 Tax=Corynebacterium urinipleomorphum TaxID=1852380 RepID=UPI001F400099|nr:signal peptidase I [Corynebacterium urinipleomorphum]
MSHRLPGNKHSHRSGSTSPTEPKTPLRRHDETNPATPTHDSDRGECPKRGAGYWIGETALTLLAIFGVVCVTAVSAAFLFDVRIMVFKTGSMGPEIPAGSVALVRMIPAEEAAVGDITTVYRENHLPITHRVISTEPDPDNPNGRIIEMQGDANDSPDIAPYKVEEVGKLFWSAPGLGKVVARLSDPRVMLAIALAAGFIVGWAFWPREDSTPKRNKRKHQTAPDRYPRSVDGE